MNTDQPIDPHNTILVLKHNGKEVGRIAAMARNANAYLQDMARIYDGMTVDYVEDKDAAMVSRLFSRP